MAMWTITLFVDVKDEQELWDAAFANFAEGNDPEDAPDYLGQRDAPDVSSCLRQLADPGISWPGLSILDSTAEAEIDLG